MGLFTYIVAGGALILVGAWESLASAFDSLNQIPSSLASAQLPQNINRPTPKTASYPSLVTFLLVSVLSVLFIVNSTISLSDAVSSKDNMGFALQLEVIAIAFLFLLYSVLGILTNMKESIRFPSKLLNVVYVFAFGEEFLLFYTQNKDPSGIENRYYDLILVPIAICLFSTMLELKSSKSTYPRLGRGIGLVLQGMWTLQMGFAFYSNLIANGCTLHERSRAITPLSAKGILSIIEGVQLRRYNLTVIWHFLITIAVVVYSFFCKMYGINQEFMQYKPLGNGGGEMQMDNLGQFTLESDDEDDTNGIKEGRSVEMQKSSAVVPESTVNGRDSHP